MEIALVIFVTVIFYQEVQNLDPNHCEFTEEVLQYIPKQVVVQQKKDRREKGILKILNPRNFFNRNNYENVTKKELVVEKRTRTYIDCCQGYINQDKECVPKVSIISSARSSVSLNTTLTSSTASTSVTKEILHAIETNPSLITNFRGAILPTILPMLKGPSGAKEATSDFSSENQATTVSSTPLELTVTPYVIESITSLSTNRPRMTVPVTPDAPALTQVMSQTEIYDVYSPLDILDSVTENHFKKSLTEISGVTRSEEPFPVSALPSEQTTKRETILFAEEFSTSQLTTIISNIDMETERIFFPLQTESEMVINDGAAIDHATHNESVSTEKVDLAEGKITSITIEIDNIGIPENVINLTVNEDDL